MKKENSTLLRKLKQYSALAAPLLAGASLANAQIVYTDVDPDVTLNSDGDLYDLDLNNDGVVDYIFYTLVGGSFTYAGVYPSFHSNSIAVNNEIVGTVASGSGVKFGFPYKLNYGDQIDSNQPLFNLFDILFPYNSTYYFFLPPMYSIFNGSPFGHWTGGVTDKYVGFHFTPDTVNWYFGWARCDVSDDAKTLVIKDYAYDPVPDEGLPAGVGDNVGVPLTPATRPFRIFGFEGVANVVISDGKLDDAFVTVTNMIGQTVLNQRLDNKITHLDLNEFGKGIYLVTINRGDEKFSKKISFR